jgi:hypothetical protein
MDNLDKKLKKRYNEDLENDDYKHNKRPRRNSESDLNDYKILKRCKYDDYFKRQDRNKQIEILNKESEIYNYFNTEIPIRYKILYSSR